ncbi:hypothetical protein BGZ83_003547 [Gryganskiella cystojenkinii]|nr:hypothetical protein BGZ83_003547 [Gryganskiella cystojenkinii]
MLSASSSSTSSASSISSSRSSSAASTMSSDSISWEDIRPRLCQLRHLHRIEFYDIHFDFDIEVVVEFLKAHDQAYHTIREIKIGGPDDVAKSTHPGLIQVIQSVRTLKVLDMTEWREATKFLDMIPTRHLETLLLGNVRMAGNVPEDQAQEATETGTANTAEAAAAEDENSEPRCHPQIEALQQCRHLKELKMPVLIDGLLEWAVQERARRVERSVVSQCPCLYASTSPFSYRSRSMFSLSSSPSPSPAYSFSTARWDDGPRPVELERVNLSGTSSGPLMSTLVHVMDAFRDSIQTLQGTSWVDSTEVLYCEQSLSWAWMLPKLELLDLQGDVAHRFRLGSLRYCPQLRVLRLSLPHSARPSRHGAQQQQQASQDDESLYGLGGDSSDQGTVMTENDNLDYQDAADTDCTLSELFCKSDKSISKNTRRYRSCDLPHLQELKLAGNWGLCDESLVRMMQSMPRLRRLALLRCDAGSGGGGGGGGEGGKTDGRRLTGQGLIRALSCLRERVQSLEVSRAWQHELEEAYGSNNDGGDGDKKNYDNGGSARVQPVDIIYHFW